MSRDFDDELRDYVEVTLDRYASLVRGLEFAAGTQHAEEKRHELERARDAQRDPMQDVLDAFARADMPNDIAGRVLGFSFYGMR
jgi:hypothetical protein